MSLGQALVAAMLVQLLMVGCGQVDLDREKAEAILYKELDKGTASSPNLSARPTLAYDCSAGVMHLEWLNRMETHPDFRVPGGDPAFAALTDGSGRARPVCEVRFVVTGISKSGESQRLVEYDVIAVIDNDAVGQWLAAMEKMQPIQKNRVTHALQKIKNRFLTLQGEKQIVILRTQRIGFRLYDDGWRALPSEITTFDFFSKNEKLMVQALHIPRIDTSDYLLDRMIENRPDK